MSDTNYIIGDTPEDLNREHNVTLKEGQISTILYVLEGYVQGNDDDELCDELDIIFEELEVAVDKHHEILDSLCDNMEINTVDTNKRVIL